MNIKLKISLLFLTLALIASSCPEERPELVTPPSFSETVNIRFLNLGRNVGLSLGLDSVPFSDLVSKYQMTKSFNPLNDSAFISLYEGNNFLFQLDRVVKFTRELNYIYIATPNPKDYTRDTLFSFTNIGDIVVSEVEASVKFVNLYADTNSRISFVKGCPGGEQISNSPLKYLDYTSADPQRAGEEFVFSLVRFFEDSFEIIGTFKTTFIPGGEYTILVNGKENETPEIFVIDELDIESNQIQTVDFVETQVAYIKQVNLSDQADQLNINGSSIGSVGVEEINDYSEIPACQSANSDTFTNTEGVEVFFSPEVNTEYIAISYNTSSTIGRELTIISPPVLNQDRRNKAVIRCMNLSSDDVNFNISLGANSNYINLNSNDTIRNFSSGLNLASKLDLKSISNPVIIDPGLMPVLVFNSKEPADYLYSFNHNFERDKNYLIVTFEKNGQIKYTVLEQTEVNKQVEEKEESAIINVINGDYGNQNHLLNLNTAQGMILNNANLVFGNTVTTAIGKGSTDLSFTGNNTNLDIESGKRYYSIKTQEQIYNFENFKQSSDVSSYKFRVANLSDINAAKVRTIAGVDTTTRFEIIDAGTMSNYISVNSQGRIFVIFEDIINEEIVFTSPEVNVNRRKIYTFILVGNKETGYRLITLQDY